MSEHEEDTSQCGEPGHLTWEQSVRWLRAHPERQELVRACYYDDPALAATRRFADSAEWRAVQDLLANKGGSALDLGAGRGIGSYGLARDGWAVTAVEPDPSPLVGAKAIRAIAGEAGLTIAVVRGYGESLPFSDTRFDLVYGRAVLHHSRDLHRLCAEVRRVLKPGGWFLATREHVISTPHDLPRFHATHALHWLHGQEHAYLMREYLDGFRSADLRVLMRLGPFETPINYFPMTDEERLYLCIKPLAMLIGRRAARRLVAGDGPVGRSMLAWIAKVRSRLDRCPGRLYTFVAQR